MVFYIMDRSFFSTLKGMVRQRELRLSADQISRNENSPDLRRAFA